MNTTDNPQHQHGDDERPAAVRQAEAGALAWRAVMHAQHSATPDHADFYSLAGDLSDTLDVVATLTRVLARQVRDYPAGLGEGRVVYDDSRGGPHPVDPARRLAHAELELEALSVAVETAGRRANDFWSAIGHIGVEDVTS
jgi:hypothetical protein